MKLEFRQTRKEILSQKCEDNHMLHNANLILKSAGQEKPSWKQCDYF